MEALKNGRDIDRIIIAEGAEGSVKKIEAMARERGIAVRREDRRQLDRITEGAAHQGVAAYASDYKYAEIGDILGLAEERGEDPFVIVCDGIEDPHNLGAIIRSAECAGAHGVIIGKRRSAGLTETAAKSSAGAVEYVLCARVTNISRAVEELKAAGIWAAACDMDGTAYTDADLKGPLALVIGGEGTGISRLVREKCDFTVSIPMKGKVNSLNASNAAAVLMYEVRRQRDGQR